MHDKLITENSYFVGGREEDYVTFEVLQTGKGLKIRIQSIPLAKLFSDGSELPLPDSKTFFGQKCWAWSPANPIMTTYGDGWNNLFFNHKGTKLQDYDLGGPNSWNLSFLRAVDLDKGITFYTTDMVGADLKGFCDDFSQALDKVYRAFLVNESVRVRMYVVREEAA